MNGAQRLVLAAGVEIKIMDYLNANGWHAFPFGQALLSPECRAMLWKFEDLSRRPSLVRWMPDIIVFGFPRGEPFTALIDAKATISETTPNYAIEISSVDAAEIYVDRMFHPTFFAFYDGGLLTPREIRQRGRLGPPNNAGSGTPYYLVEKRSARRFQNVFPPSAPAKAGDGQR